MTAAAYWSGLAGPFVFDDYNNIVGNPGVRIEDGSWASLWQALMSGEAGPLKRPLSMLSFAVNYLFTGIDPFPFKLTNLCIHLLNGCLVFALSRRLLVAVGVRAGVAPHQLALVVAGVWLLHPVQLTSVLYVVQRMTSLSATFVFVSLLVYLEARAPARAPAARRLLLWFAFPFCVGLAALAKENGVLAIAYAFVIELTVFRFRCSPGERLGTPQQFFFLALALPLYGILVYLGTHPEWFDKAAGNRTFTTAERLLTEARVLFLYLQMLVIPAISNMAMFYDDFPVSRSLFEPASTLWAVLGLGFACVSAALLRSRAPWYSLAVFWFLAGHAMESTIIMLELVHPHRNYVAYLGPMLALTVGGASLLAKASRLQQAASFAIVILALGGTTALRAYQWRNPLDLAVFEVRHRPDSPRANYEVARLLNIAATKTGDDTLNQDAQRYLQRAAELEPTDVSALIGLAITSGGRIEPAVMNELRERLLRRPLPPNQISYLQALITCQRQQNCKTPPDQIQLIFATLLQHPHLRPKVKADALTILGIYYAEQLHDYLAAARLMREALTMTPDDTSRHLNLAQVLLFIPDFDAAEQVLRDAERSDSLGAQRQRIAKIRGDIARMRAAPQDAVAARPAVAAE